MKKPSLKAVIDEHATRLHAIDGVIGVAEGADKGEPCIIVFVSDENRDSSGKISAELKGYSVRIVITGGADLRD